VRESKLKERIKRTQEMKKKRVNEKKRHFRKIHETEKEMMENNNER
jgi:hypothetical protein